MIVYSDLGVWIWSQYIPQLFYDQDMKIANSFVTSIITPEITFNNNFTSALMDNTLLVLHNFQSYSGFLGCNN